MNIREVISIHAAESPPVQAPYPNGEGPSSRPQKLKIPTAIQEEGLWKCPQLGCNFNTKHRTSYNYHHASMHSLTYKYICIQCGGGFHKPSRYNSHELTCKGSKELNQCRAGKPLRYTGQREIRRAHPLPNEEAAQEQEVQIEELTNENGVLKAQVKKLEDLLVKKDIEINELRKREKSSNIADNCHLESAQVVLPEVEPALVELYQVEQVPLEVSPMETGPRRSVRRTARFLEEQRKQEIISKIRTGHDLDSGLKVNMVELENIRQRAIFTERSFKTDEFVVEYAGVLRTGREGKTMEKLYGEDPSIGSFIYFFWSCDKSYCVDATLETPRIGRLINHCKKKPSLVSRLLIVDGIKRICFFAKRDIQPGEEVTFDYGDRSPISIKDNEWLRN